MIGFVMIGVLAAFGALCALWVLFGLLLPRPRGGMLVYVCPAESQEVILRRYFWLRDLGLLRCPLVLIDSDLEPRRMAQVQQKCRSVLFFTKEQWIEQERNRFGSDGDADAAGNDRGDRLPEL